MLGHLGRARQIRITSLGHLPGPEKNCHVFDRLLPQYITPRYISVPNYFETVPRKCACQTGISLTFTHTKSTSWVPCEATCRLCPTKYLILYRPVYRAIPLHNCISIRGAQSTLHATPPLPPASLPPPPAPTVNRYPLLVRTESRTHTNSTSKDSSGPPA